MKEIGCRNCLHWHSLVPECDAKAMNEWQTHITISSPTGRKESLQDRDKMRLKVVELFKKWDAR